MRSKFRNIHKVHISPLDFEGLPEYETTDEEEEGEGDKEEIAVPRVYEDLENFEVIKTIFEKLLEGIRFR